MIQQITAQHENIPYENVANICETCVCIEAQDVGSKNQTNHMLSCVMKGFKHILARWPEEFNRDNNKGNFDLNSNCKHHFSQTIFYHC